MTRVERWERKAEIPLLILAATFLVAYAWPVLNQHMGSSLRDALSKISWVVWAAFAVDFGARILLADHRRRYVMGHWYDVILITLPMLRPLRLLRLIALARILNRSAASSLVGRVSAYVVGVAVAAVNLGAIAVLDAEEKVRGSNIKTFGDAIWWSATTVTTVGYGDHYPVTVTGRIIAVVLMLVGLGMVGVLTAAIAAWFINQVQLDPQALTQRRGASRADRPADRAREGDGDLIPVQGDGASA